PAYRVCEPDALDLRRLALSAGHRRAARRRPPRAGDPVGQRQRVPCLHPRGTHPLAGARVIAALLIALGQVLVAGAGAPLLVGLDSGSAFGGMGSSREVAVAALAEPTIIVAVFAVALRAETINLGGIVERLAREPLLAANPAHLLAFVAFFIVMLAETGRLP